MGKFKGMMLASLILALAACSSDPYKDMPRNCTNYLGAGVVCSQPVNLKGVINQSRKQVESVLGKGRVDDHKGHSVGTYRGGGILVRYNHFGVCEAVEIYPENLDMKKSSILSYLSAESITTLPRGSIDEEGAMILWDGDRDFYTFVAISHPDNIMRVGVIKSDVKPASEW